MGKRALSRWTWTVSNATPVTGVAAGPIEPGLKTHETPKHAHPFSDRQGAESRPRRAAKGGFYAKRLPDQEADGAAWLAEGIESYKDFLRGLLDVTDNLAPSDVVVSPAARGSRTQVGRVVPPPDVIRHPHPTRRPLSRNAADSSICQVRRGQTTTPV